MRTTFLKVPLDVFTKEDIPAIMDTFIAGGKHQIVFISILDLMRARRNSRYMSMLKNSSLVVPVSASICKAWKFAARSKAQWFTPFDFVIKMLGHLDEKKKSLYILGSKPDELQKISGNLRTSFPGISIVGRHTGYFPAEKEKDILTAIKKASPTCTLCGTGIRGRNFWVHENLKYCNDGIFVWNDYCFHIFSGKKEKESRWLWESGLKTFFYHLFRPWRWYRILIYFHFLVLTLCARIFGL